MMTVFAASACSSPSDEPTSGDGVSDVASEVAETLGIDLSQCPDDPTKKFGAEVNVGLDIPQSGPGAPFAPIANAIKAAFDNFNATSGLDTKFNLKVLDSQFAPDKAASNMKQLVESDNIVAATSEIGTGQVLAVSPILSQNCVPLIPAAGNGVAVNDAKQFPWLVNTTLLNETDMRGYISHITETFPDGAKIAVLAGNTASGDDVLAAIERLIEGANHEIVATERIEAAEAGAPSSQVTTMRNSGAEVLIGAPTGAQCLTLMTEVAKQGWKPVKYLYNGCPIQLFAAAGDAADGVFNIQNGILPGDPRYQGQVDELTQLLDEYAPGTELNATTLVGFQFADAFFTAAKDAADSDLGLSKLGLIEAAAHMSYQSEALDSKITVSMDRPDDDVAMETVLLNQFNSKTGLFENVATFDFEGKITEQVAAALGE